MREHYTFVNAGGVQYPTATPDKPASKWHVIGEPDNPTALYNKLCKELNLNGYKWRYPLLAVKTNSAYDMDIKCLKYDDVREATLNYLRRVEAPVMVKYLGGEYELHRVYTDKRDLRRVHFWMGASDNSLYAGRRLVSMLEDYLDAPLAKCQTV